MQEPGNPSNTSTSDGASTPHESGHETLYDLRWPLAEKVYLVLVAVFVTLLVLTNIIGQKLFLIDLEIFDLNNKPMTAGLLTYPLTFLVTDIVSEIYGKKRADRMVWTGFAMSLLMLGVVQLSMYVTPHQFWAVENYKHLFPDGDHMQTAWEAVFGVGPWLVTGSMLAYLAAQLCDNFMFHFWRRLTGGKHLWLRNNGSTWLSQLVDTFIVNSFLFYGAFGWEFMRGLEVMFAIYICKLVIAALDTPICYLGIGWVRNFLRRRGAFAKTS